MPKQVTISIGIGSVGRVDERIDKEMLIKRADKALLDAKAKGKDQVVIWSEDL